eukprot:2151792-Pyramimonas_sp.AAC.1
MPLGASGDISCTLLGGLLVHLGGLLAVPGPLGASWVLLGSLVRGLLRASWGPAAGLLGVLGGLSGPSWGLLS